MSLPRTPEPIPDDPEAEAAEYHRMDHSAVNQIFVDDLIAGGPVGPQVIDLGAGPAQIAIELCRRLPGVTVMAVDAAVPMLEIAKFEIECEGMLDRVLLQHADVTAMTEFENEMADTVISNSLIHHLDEPVLGLQSCVRLLRSPGRLFVRDLARPESAERVERLVAEHVAGETAEAQQLFRQSLHAALNLQEIREIAGGLGIDAQQVQMTSDRHWTIDWTR